MYEIHFEVYNLHFEVYNLHFEVFNLQFQVYNVHFELYNLHFEVYNIQYYPMSNSRTVQVWSQHGWCIEPTKLRLVSIKKKHREMLMLSKPRVDRSRPQNTWLNVLLGILIYQQWY